MKKQLIFTLLLLIPCFVFSQEYTEIFDNIWGMGENLSTPVCSDIDNDQLLDLIVGNQDGKLTHYKQEAVGSHNFRFITDYFNEIDAGEFSTPCFIDLDQDDRLDLLIGGQHGNIWHYEQETVNSLDFTLIGKNFNEIEVGYGSAPYCTNLDNDGLLDLIVAERVGNLNYYEQEAVNSEIFTLVDETLSGIIAEWRPRPFFLDLDQDDLLDLIIGGGNGNLQHFEQDETGSLTFTLISNAFNNINVGYYSAPWFVDLDGDERLDLLIGEEDGFLNHYAQDAENPATFHLITEKMVNGIIDVGVYAAPAFGDLNSDGLYDLLVGNEQGKLYYYQQHSKDSPGFDLVSENFGGIDVGRMATPFLTDLNDNGRYDLIIGESVGNLNYYEQETIGSLNFRFIADTLAGVKRASFAAPCVLDLDGDGLLDLVVGEQEGHLYHYEQDAPGSIRFVWLSDSLGNIDVGDLSSPAFTDLDQDGLLDLLAGNRSSKVFHYEQDATGSTSFEFKSDHFNNIYISNARPSFPDLNGDGMADYLLGSYYGDIHYFQRTDETFIERKNLNKKPQSFVILQNYPNPFNPVTTIQYSLPRSAPVRISIFNTLGQTVKIFLQKDQPAGSHSVRWDGTDENGDSLPGGIYLCRLTAGSAHQSIKLLLLK